MKGIMRIDDVQLMMEYTIGPSESVSTAVIQAVSEFESCSPESLPSLHDNIDTDGLDTVFRGQSRSGVRLMFEYSNSHVAVENGESIIVIANPSSQTIG